MEGIQQVALKGQQKEMQKGRTHTRAAPELAVRTHPYKHIPLPAQLNIMPHKQLRRPTLN